MIQEFINGLITAANLDLQPAAFGEDVDDLGAEQVDALALADELDLDPLLVRVIIHELGKSHIDRVCLNGNIDGETGFQISHVGLQRSYLF